MQHRRVGKILKREKGPREALFRSLARSIVLKSAITTTEAKAKAIRPILERLITTEKKGTLAGHRTVVAALGKDAAAHLKKEIIPKMVERKGGYLRITKLGVRKSDAAPMANISIVQ